DDLHDGLGQHLAGIAIKAKLLEDDLAAAAPAHVLRARHLVGLLNNAIKQTRALARGLDPIEVDVNGLGPALQRLAAETTELFQVACTAHCEAPGLPASKSIGIQLYRIAQEAISNAAKHAKPRRIEIRLAAQSTHIRLRIKDDGCGFRTEGPCPEGMGLRI